MIKLLRACVAVALVAAAPAARAGGFSTTNVQLLQGYDFKDPLYYTGGTMTTLTLNTFSTWEYGDSFFFADMYTGHFKNGFDPAVSTNYAPFQAAMQTQIKTLRCPSTSDELTYDDDSRGVLVPQRYAVSYGVVVSGSIGNPSTSRAGEQSSYLDDGTAGPPQGPFRFPELVAGRFDGPFKQNITHAFADIVDGTSNTAMIGERYRTDQSNGNAGTGGWGYWAIGSPDSQDGAGQWSGTTGEPFNILLTITSNTERKIMYCGYRSRHANGCNFVFCDGHVRFMTDATSDEVRLAMGTRAGGEPVNVEQ